MRTTPLAIALSIALAGCRPGPAMRLCKKAELAGVLKDCETFEGGKDGAAEVTLANDVQTGGMSRMLISVYDSDQSYEFALHRKEQKSPRCLYGNPKKRIIVQSHTKAIDDVCRAVYDVVDSGE